MDRRTVLAAGLLAPAMSPRQVPHRVDITPADLSGDQAALGRLVAGYERTAPAVSSTAAWDLASRAAVRAQFAAPKLAPDWVHVAGRALVLRANAQLDQGLTTEAAQSAARATAVAIRIRDTPTVAHAYAVRAEVCATLREWDRVVVLCRQGAQHAGRAPVGVMLAGSEAIAHAELGDRDAMMAALVLAERRMTAVPASLHGGVGYSDGTYHPAQLAACAGRALVQIGDVEAAEIQITDLLEWADGARATGLATFGRLLAARSAAVATRWDVVRENLADAIVTARTANRPTTWLAGAAARLARQGEPAGVSLHDLVGLAQA